MKCKRFEDISIKRFTDCLMPADWKSVNDESAIVNAHARYEVARDSFSNRFTKKVGDDAARWEHFMVDGGRNMLWKRTVNGGENDEVKGQKWWEQKPSEAGNQEEA